MNWTEKNNALHKSFSFDNFKQAIDFMSHCREDIDQVNHHPEWTNVYNRLEVRLCTHDAGNVITEKDHQLAKLLDEKYREFKS